MHIKVITFVVEDMAKSLSFYQDILGFKIVEEKLLGKQHLVFLKSDSDVLLELICRTDESYVKNINKNLHIGIEFTNIAEIIAKLDKNGYTVKGPISPIPSVTFYFVTDPNGFDIQLVVA